MLDPEWDQDFIESLDAVFLLLLLPLYLSFRVIVVIFAGPSLSSCRSPPVCSLLLSQSVHVTKSPVIVCVSETELAPDPLLLLPFYSASDTQQ